MIQGRSETILLCESCEVSFETAPHLVTKVAQSYGKQKKQEAGRAPSFFDCTRVSLLRMSVNLLSSTNITLISGRQREPSPFLTQGGDRHGGNKMFLPLWHLRHWK
mgnify:CR=1 FL=1